MRQLKRQPHIFFLFLLLASCQKREKEIVETMEQVELDAATSVAGTYHPVRVSFYWKEQPADQYKDSLQITKLDSNTIELHYYITSVTDGPHPSRIYKVERKDEVTYEFFDLERDLNRPRFTSKNDGIDMLFADGQFVVTFAKKKKN